jgi:hypothetical protein
VETIQSFGISSNCDVIAVQSRCRGNCDADRRQHVHGRRNVDETTSFSSTSHSSNQETRSVCSASYATLPLAPVNLRPVANIRRSHQLQPRPLLPATLERRYERPAIIDRTMGNGHDSSARGLLRGHVPVAGAPWYQRKAATSATAAVFDDELRSSTSRTQRHGKQ